MLAPLVRDRHSSSSDGRFESSRQSLTTLSQISRRSKRRIRKSSRHERMAAWPAAASDPIPAKQSFRAASDLLNRQIAIA